MTNRSKQILRLALLAAGAVALTGCDSLRNAAGMGKDQPDEFAVVTKAPLVLPPDYNLRPPRDGAPPTNQIDPTTSAQTALFDSQDPATAAKMIPGDYSESEKQVLASAGAVNPDHGIRQLIATDDRSAEASNDDFTKKVLFWQGEKTPGTNVDAESEARRIDAQKNGGATPQTKKPSDSATIDKKEDKGGWFDWF